MIFCPSTYVKLFDYINLIIIFNIEITDYYLLVVCIYTRQADTTKMQLTKLVLFDYYHNFTENERKSTDIIQTTFPNFLSSENFNEREIQHLVHISSSCGKLAFAFSSKFSLMKCLLTS